MGCTRSAYAPLIWSICRRYGISGPAAEDVVQHVWLHLVESLNDLRDPAALPGWISTTTRRECCRIRRVQGLVADDTQVLENLPDGHAKTVEHELLMAERHATLREAFAACRCPSSDCWLCSSPTHPCPTPRSAPGSASRSGASARTAAAPWTGCAATRPSSA